MSVLSGLKGTSSGSSRWTTEEEVQFLTLLNDNVKTAEISEVLSRPVKGLPAKKKQLFLRIEKAGLPEGHTFEDIISVITGVFSEIESSEEEEVS